jgi:hypothetical protein
MKPVVRKSWRELSEAAAREHDPEKLLELVEQLNRALEEEEAKRRGPEQQESWASSISFTKTRESSCAFPGFEPRA